MDLLKIAKILPKQKEKLDWGEANSLWALARNKLIGLSTLEVYLSQVVDNELKLLIEMGIKKVAVPHIESINKLLHKEGLEIPSMLGRTSLEKIGKNTGNTNFLKDHEIAVSLREIIRLALFLSIRGLENAYRDDVLNLIWDILQDDFQGFKQVIALQKGKNWLLPTPGVGTQENYGKERLNWGEASGLWNIARDKLIKLTLLEVYLSQVSDPELKEFVKTGLKKTIVPHLEKIFSLMHKEGLEIPSMFNRTSFENIGRDTGNLNWLKDHEIAVLMREQLRLVLLVDFEALVDTVRNDISDLVWGFFIDDFQMFKQIIELQKRNNWLLPPPSVQPEHK